MAADNDLQTLELLFKENYISAEDVEAAKKYSEHQHASPIDYLQREGLVSKQLLGQAVAELHQMPFIDLSVHEPTAAQLQQLPEALARAEHAIVVNESDHDVTVATDVPGAKGDQLQAALKGKAIKFVYAMPDDIENVLRQYRQPLQTRFSQITTAGHKVAPEIIVEIFEDALTFNASDIHFEPQTEQVVVRFRVDGVLQEAGRFDKQYYENVLNRVKVLAHLRIDEHFSVQDGAIRYVARDKSAVDLRVSVAPTIEGEKVAIRLLNSEIAGFSLSDIGLSAADQVLFAGASKQPFGMILVTGPTGSGKTTSLYSVIKIIKRPEINITTIEDPVEYRVVGINQIQVNPQTNITFSEGLRSIVRQDPDVILVGEIRDRDTAEIAVNAALTGHLLLSTFHANDAATAIPRLIEMGIEPFLLSSTLQLVIAQRLVRRICEVCRYGKNVDHGYLETLLPDAHRYFGESPITLYEGKGCDNCHGVGFKGRTAVFELITMTPALKALTLKRPSRDEVWAEAVKSGAHSLFEDGVEKVKKGVTTIEELIRTVPPPGKV